MYDLVIRNGTIVDGSGAPAFDGDIGIRYGMIVAIGKIGDRGREEIDASGRIVTPGFVDVHSHYDGQATWDSTLDPSAGHGVTTVVMGNCGVGFAPVRPGIEARRELIELMEGVEDIPGTALWEGIDWTWESFPEYLDTLAKRNFTMDVAAIVPHAAVRTYVMGDRAIRHEAATGDDIAAMANLVAEGIRAGGIGFSTSRILGHQSIDGTPVPGTFAAEDEMRGIGEAVARAGGVFQLVPGGSTGSGKVTLEYEGFAEASLRDEITWMGDLSRETGLKCTFLLAEDIVNPDTWRSGLGWTEEENSRGAQLIPQIAGRAGGLLLGFEGRHMFERRPTYMKLASLPFGERIAELRHSDVRKAILAESNTPVETSYITDNIAAVLPGMLGATFPLGEIVNYEPTSDMSVAALAAQKGVDPQDLAYDLMLEQDGHALLMAPFINYALGNEDAIHTMLTHPQTVLGLADGGAHCSIICDASMPTYLLSHWVRGRRRGPRLPLERAVAMQTSETAGLFGMSDRGRIALGLRADLNVINLDQLRILPPRIVHDLPANGQRLIQEARGYDATIVNGIVVRRGDRDTGARPGALWRSNSSRSPDRMASKRSAA